MLAPRASVSRVIFALLAFACGAAATLAADKKALLVAGAPSHGPGAHEHNAGVLLLQRCLGGVNGLRTEVILNGGLTSATQLEGFDAIVLYCDGGVRHVALQRDNLANLNRVLSRGVGFGALHYAVEPTLPNGQREFLKWLGGAFEIKWSVNPHWDADFKSLPKHPITRGVSPFKLRDEWYFNMRFAEGMKGVTPILVAVPDASTTSRPDGDHSGNPTVRAAVARGEPQTVAWAYERPGGGRGFGFTGGHYHQNWGNDQVRTLALNAIVWLAGLEVPAGGVRSAVTAEDLKQNLDPKPAPRKAAPKKS